MPRATSMPSSPVQALAQPLFTTIARATPPAAGEMLARDDDRRRLRAVGREHRRGGRRRSDTSSARSRPARLDAGADAGGAKALRQRHAARERFERLNGRAVMRGGATTADRGRAARRAGIERQHHRVLAAPLKVRALHAVGEDLLGQPQVRHDREAHLDEIAGHVGERAQLLEAFAARPLPQLVDEHRADAAVPRGLVHGQRSHFRHLGLSGASSAQPTIVRPRTATTKRSAWAVSSARVRGSRCPSSRFAVISACSFAACDGVGGPKRDARRARS